MMNGAVAAGPTARQCQQRNSAKQAATAKNWEHGTEVKQSWSHGPSVKEGPTDSSHEIGKAANTSQAQGKWNPEIKEPTTSNTAQKSSMMESRFNR
jgi:hypothetical protein